MAGEAHKGVSRAPRVCRIVTVPQTFSTLLRKQITCVADAGIDLTLVSSPGPELDAIALAAPGVNCRAIPMTRGPSPLRDGRSLLTLTRLFRERRFDIVHSSTPKAGLLTALAGVAARTPVRIHTFTGQVWVELHGLIRWVSRQSDGLIVRLDSFTYADSASQRDFLVAQGLVSPHKISVLGPGSISGVDLHRFAAERVPEVRAEVRRELGIGQDVAVIVFVGRVTRDKGVAELVDAFRALRQHNPDVVLLVVGPRESERSPLPPAVLDELSNGRNTRSIGFTARPEDYMAAGDVFCLPSYREGFGSVVIEAAALGLPAVATRIVGLVDAVVEGVTGLLVPPKDPASLAAALDKLISSVRLRRQFGEAARQRATAQFDASVVDRLVIDEYLRLASGQT